MNANDWNDWHTFMTVAELGSFTRAAEKLRLPRSTVSLAVSRLEQTLGITLMMRTTRRLRLTDTGTRLLQDIKPHFDQMEEVVSEAVAAREEPYGTLRIATPYEFGAFQLGDVICRILDRYPALEIQVDVISHLVDPLTGGYDVAFGFVEERLPDSTLVSRRIFSIERGVFAAPSLLQRYGPLDSPEDLERWPCMVNPRGSAWTFTDPEGRKHAVRLSGRLRTANVSLRVQAAIAGLGAIATVRHLCEPHIKTGELVDLLPRYRPDPWYVFALLPSRRLMPAKVRVFMDMVTQALSPG